MKNNRILHAINLSTLPYWVFPLGNIILPLILWIINKDKVKGANQFTITFIIYGLISIL
ncbi:MAG: DUF4870 domain-containing protein [Bacteroidota bacterium]